MLNDTELKVTQFGFLASIIAEGCSVALYTIKLHFHDSKRATLNFCDTATWKTLSSLLLILLKDNLP